MPRRTTPDAVALIKEDHRKVEKLFEQFEKARDQERKKDLARQVCTQLTIHAMIEEEIFYPACQGKIEDEDVLDEAYVEHDGAKVLIAEIEAGGPDDEFYDAKVKVLSEMIKHHVKEEEKPGGMFSEARKSNMDLEHVGQRLKARKGELEADRRGGSFNA
jgi:hemerythrin superfamily protein